MKDKRLTHDWTTGQLNALVKKLGEKNARRIIAGELTLKQSDDGATAELVKVVQKLFDRHGRRIPQDFTAAVCDPNRNFRLIQPKLDYEERHRRYFGLFGDPGMIADEFYRRSEVLIYKLKADESLASLLKGVHLPIILPQLPGSFDYGELLETRLMQAVKIAFAKEFPGRTFGNHCRGELAGEVKIVHPSHERLVAELKANPRVGLYFPNSLQGFSVLASREQMDTLPENFYLAGGIDTAAAMAMYPDVLARDIDNTPRLDMASISWRSSESSLRFGPGDDDSPFGGGCSSAEARGDYSSGLLFLD